VIICQGPASPRNLFKDSFYRFCPGKKFRNLVMFFNKRMNGRLQFFD
jgi:hypothetical protein